ncbi:MAG: histone deacetylase [bacterium]|nr:histone deacetylase [bacterium]
MLDRIRAWFTGRFDPPGPRFVIHRQYDLGSGTGDYDGRRPFRVLSYLEHRRLLRRGMVHRPRPASLKRLQRIHDLDYLRSLEESGALTGILGAPVDPATQDRCLAYQRAVCGGTLRAMRLALQRRHVAMNLGGGLHHAARDRGAGYCVFNDVALAVDALRHKGRHLPVLVIDLDIHDGDGTREIFAADPSVHTFSIHNRDLGTREAVASTSVALGTGVTDDTYLAALHEHLPRVVNEFRPGLVFYLAGADPSVNDRLGDWRISLEGLLARDRFVFEQIGLDRRRGGPVPCVALMAGGYGRSAWRHGAALGSWLLTGNADLDIPLEMELPLDQFRRLAKLMGKSRARRSRADRNEDDWGLTAGDLVGAAPDAERRFLGRFTRHGVELAIEESGLLERLRGRGYKELRVDLDLDDPLGDTLRVVAAEAAPAALLELRLREDRSALPGRALLGVEWLLLQDTGQRYEMTRPLLPGQSHPGLGLLRETAAVLIVVCERLELEGIVFTPSHYHLARLARPLARFLDPEMEGRCRAVDRVVRHLRLDEAVAAVEGGCVFDTVTNKTVRWEPSPLVIPVSRELKTQFEVGDWEEKAAVAAKAQEMRLSRDR